MDTIIFMLFVTISAVVYYIYSDNKKEREAQAIKFEQMPQEEKDKFIASEREKAIEAIRRYDEAMSEVKARGKNTRDTMAYGSANSAMICPHCQTRGKVRTRRIGAGIGMRMNYAHCENCKNDWEWGS